MSTRLVSRSIFGVAAALAVGLAFGVRVDLPLGVAPAYAADGRYIAQDAWPGVAFQIPIAVTAPRDGSDRLFVVERAGRILVGKKFRAGQPVAPPSVFLDITRLQMQGEALENGHGGLVNLAFPPNFAQSGQFIVYYGTGAGTAPDPYRTVIASYRVSAQNPNVADPASGRILLSINKKNPIHFGGGLCFGPDGMLYIGVGDSGEKDDPSRLGQDTRTLEAKILRININGTGGKPYDVPADNPWADGRGGVKSEIFAYGVRNPWRMSFDRGTGRLWTCDLGQKRKEEIDVVPRAGNLGWPMFEADQPLVPGGRASDYVMPVFSYGRDEKLDGTAAVVGKCTIGGAVYRGQRCPTLVGHLVFGDNSSVQMSNHEKTGRIWAMPVAEDRTTGNPFPVADVEDIVSVDEDAQGELYFSCLATGKVMTLVPAP
jgi:glucose/arabinose dehydrogenase